MDIFNRYIHYNVSTQSEYLTKTMTRIPTVITHTIKTVTLPSQMKVRTIQLPLKLSHGHGGEDILASALSQNNMCLVAVCSLLCGLLSVVELARVPIPVLLFLPRANLYKNYPECVLSNSNEDLQIWKHDRVQFQLQSIKRLVI